MSGIGIFVPQTLLYVRVVRQLSSGKGFIKMASAARQMNAKPSLHKINVQAPPIDIIGEFEFEEFPAFNISEKAYKNQSLGDVFAYPNEEITHFDVFVDILSQYGIPLIIAVGCVGNTLSFSVFVGSHLKFQSSSVYLAFLNFVDTLFLLILFIGWLYKVNINLVNREVLCQMVIYISNVGGFLSVYTVVSFTIERWIVVFHPLKKNFWCTRRTAFLTVSVLMLAAMVIYSFTFWSTGLVQIAGAQFCLPKPKFYRTVQILTTIDTVVTLLLPSVIIIVLNVNIATKIWQFIHKESEKNELFVMYPSVEQHLSKSSFYFEKHCTDEVSGSIQLKKNSRMPSMVSYHTTRIQDNGWSKRSKQMYGKRRLRAHVRTTRSLLIVSTVFVCLNLPSHAFRIYAVVTELMDPGYMYPKTGLQFQQIFQLVYYINFAANFFLYSACSKTFRQAFKRLCQKLKRKFLSNGTRMLLYCKLNDFV